MKKIVFILLLAVLAQASVQAQIVTQRLPDSTNVIPYLLEVGYNTSTIVVFPVPIIDADRGYTDIIIEKQKEVENILKVKAVQKNFAPTNIHVYTNDGRLYAFRVQYAEFPARTTFDLHLLQGVTDKKPVSYSQPAITTLELQQKVEQLKNKKRFLTRHNRKHHLQIRLESIYQVKDMLILGYSMTNKSTLKYDIDYSRLLVRDRKKTKRSSYQQYDMNPVLLTPIKEIGPNTSKSFFIAVPKFTIPGNKECVLQAFEKNGGRHLSLSIKNRHLLKARAF